MQVSHSSSLSTELHSPPLPPSFVEAKSLGIPPPPKAPLGAYAEFFRELYPTIRNDHVREDGRIDSHEVARVAGAKWNTLSEDDRKVSSHEWSDEEFTQAYIAFFPSFRARRTHRTVEIQPSGETSDREVQARL